MINGSRRQEIVTWLIDNGFEMGMNGVSDEGPVRLTVWDEYTKVIVLLPEETRLEDGLTEMMEGALRICKQNKRERTINKIIE